MNKRKVAELENQARMMWGYDPKSREKSEQDRRTAEKWQKNPLAGFPNDIVYFTHQEIIDKLAVSQMLWKKMEPLSRWNTLRGNACRGKLGIVARRCSMNDQLWNLWIRSKEVGSELTLDKVHKMILLDIKRSRLYPPGWTDSSVDPPKWYIQKLRKAGRLDHILKEIDEVMN